MGLLHNALSVTPNIQFRISDEFKSFWKEEIVVYDTGVLVARLKKTKRHILSDYCTKTSKR
jgi:hypothetical protein